MSSLIVLGDEPPTDIILEDLKMQHTFEFSAGTAEESALGCKSSLRVGQNSLWVSDQVNDGPRYHLRAGLALPLLAAVLGE